MEAVDLEKIKRGREAEEKFQAWLDEHKLSYLYIQQDKNTFANAFKDNLKRPDFLILLPNLGLIMVDVKYKNVNSKYQDMAIDAYDIKRYSKLQRIFNLPIWFVLSNENVAFETWFWIPLPKVLEEGMPRFTSSKSQMDYYAVPLKHFIQVSKKDSINRLFESFD